MPVQEYPMPEEGVQDGWLIDGQVKVSSYPDKNGNEYDIMQLTYRLAEEMADGTPFEVTTKWFPFHWPHKVMVENQNALAGRMVADDEDFDFADYKGKQVRINIVHEANKEGKVFANIAKVSPAKTKKKVAAVVADDFPDDEDEEF
jgi:hypothetical protein